MVLLLDLIVFLSEQFFAQFCSNVRLKMFATSICELNYQNGDDNDYYVANSHPISYHISMLSSRNFYFYIWPDVREKSYLHRSIFRFKWQTHIVSQIHVRLMEKS